MSSRLRRSRDRSLAGPPESSTIHVSARDVAWRKRGGIQTRAESESTAYLGQRLVSPRSSTIWVSTTPCIANTQLASDAARGWFAFGSEGRYLVAGAARHAHNLSRG
eukprot:2670936-Rhodomonas_salina.1